MGKSPALKNSYEINLAAIWLNLYFKRFDLALVYLQKSDFDLRPPVKDDVDAFRRLFEPVIDAKNFTLFKALVDNPTTDLMGDENKGVLISVLFGISDPILLEMAKYLLASLRLDPNIPARLPLSYAIAYSSVEPLRLLLTNPRLKLESTQEYSPLADAIGQDREGAFHELMKQKQVDINPLPVADINNYNIAYAPLVLAILSKNPVYLTELMERQDINVNVVSGHSDNMHPSPLGAALVNNIGFAKALLKRSDIDVNLDTYRGTPIYSLIGDSAENLSVDTMKLLLDRSDVNINYARSFPNDKFKTRSVLKTAILAALNHGRIDLLKILLDRKDLDVNQAGADLNDSPLTFFLRFTYSEPHPEVLELLLSRSDFRCVVKGSTEVHPINKGVLEKHGCTFTVD